jgi:hypothetical protein
MAAAINTGSRQVSVVTEPGADGLLQWVTTTLERFDVRPSVRIAVPHAMLFQVHQQLDGREIFLFSNQELDKAISFHGSFATGDLTPWRWNPETGERSVFPHGAMCNELDITLEPLASLLLVFEPNLPGTAMSPDKTARSDALAIKPPWQLTLEPAFGQTVTMDLQQLEDLGLSDNQILNSFAGNAVYRVNFDVTAASQSMLSLGRVHGVSEVTLNGKALGVRWWGTEHLYDTQDALRQGNNELEVKVTTVLSNYCRTLKDNKMAMNWAGNHQPVSTGLLGPVTIYRKTAATAKK